MKRESGKAPVDMLVIDRIERPSENRSRCQHARPWPCEIELDETADALEIAFIVADEDASRLAAGHGQQHVIGERLRDSSDFQTVLPCHIRQHITGPVPRVS